MSQSKSDRQIKDRAVSADNRQDRDRQPAATRKTRGTFLLPADLLEQLRDASYWARQSQAQIAERALLRELMRMKEQFNDGQDFRRRPAA